MNDEKLVKPKNWDEMNFVQQWMWILDRQREIDEKYSKAF